MGSFSKKRVELSDFLTKFIQTITNSSLGMQGLPQDQFLNSEIEKIHEELANFRYVLFYFVMLDAARYDLIEGLDWKAEETAKGTFFRSLFQAHINEGLPEEEANKVTNHIKDLLNEYQSKVSNMMSKEYEKEGYKPLVFHCLKRCGFIAPKERTENEPPVAKNEGVLDLIQQVYLKIQEALDRTLKRYKVYFEA